MQFQQQQTDEESAFEAVVSVPAEAQPAPILEANAAEENAMRALLRRLQRNRALQEAVRACLAPESLPTKAFHCLLAALEQPLDNRWRERTVAAWALGRANLSPEQATAAANALRDVVEYRLAPESWLARKRVGRAFLRLLPVLIPLFLLAMHGLGIGLDSGLWQWIIMFIMILIGVPSLQTPILLLMVPSIRFDERRSNRARAAALMTLERLCLPETIGTPAWAIFDKDRQVRKAAESALNAILPTLTPEHYGRLDAEAIPNLCRIIDKEAQVFRDTAGEELVYRTLEALGKVGDGSAVPYVQRLAQTGRTTRIQELATRILPTLEERQRQEQAREMLLRGASMPVAAGETLLRPVVDTFEQESGETLLRATYGEGDAVTTEEDNPI
jgi:hypothetical protein